MTSKLNQPKTPTEILIDIMENADEIKDIIVIYKTKEDEHGRDDLAYHSNLQSLFPRLALVEEYKVLNITRSYGIEPLD